MRLGFLSRANPPESWRNVCPSDRIQQWNTFMRECVFSSTITFSGQSCFVQSRCFGNESQPTNAGPEEHGKWHAQLVGSNAATLAVSQRELWGTCAWTVAEPHHNIPYPCSQPPAELRDKSGFERSERQQPDHLDTDQRCGCEHLDNLVLC